MEIYSLFDIGAIVFNDCVSEIQQKHHSVGSSRQLVFIKALFYDGSRYNELTTIAFFNTTFLRH